VHGVDSRALKFKRLGGGRRLGLKAKVFVVLADVQQS
jgi:hypothetical protein